MEFFFAKNVQYTYELCANSLDFSCFHRKNPGNELADSCQNDSPVFHVLITPHAVFKTGNCCFVDQLYILVY